MKIEFYLHLFIVLPDKCDGSNLKPCDIAGLVEDMEVVVRWHSVDWALPPRLSFWWSPADNSGKIMEGAQIYRYQVKVWEDV